MPDITDFQITMQGSALLFFLLLASGGMTVFFMYRATVPPLPFWKRLPLAVCRACAITAIIAMLFMPVFTISTDRSEKPVIALLVDTSASMNVVDQNGSRGEAVLSILRSTGFRELDQNFDIRYYTYDRSVKGFEPAGLDTLRFKGEGTDISGALRISRDINKVYSLRGLILLSDGIHNLGEDPVRTAERLGTPVYTVGIGDATPRKDILISNLQTNEIAYAGNKVPVTVIVKSIGFPGVSTSVALSEGGRTVDAQIIQLPEDNMERSVTFDYFPEAVGVRRLNVSVTAQDGELSAGNNEREFFIKVLESKIKILVISGRPNQDQKFLIRSLSSKENFSVTGLTQRPGEFYNSDAAEALDRIGSFHLFILIDFPGSAGAGNVINALVREALENNKPVMFIRGEKLDANRLNSMMEVLNITDVTAQGNEEEIYIQIDRNAYSHPVFRISESLDENASLWYKLPPLYTGSGTPVPADGSTIIGTIDPVRSAASLRTGIAQTIFLMRNNQRKTLFFNVYNLWRWQFMSLRDPEISGVYDRLMENSVRWLITQEDSKLVNISPSREFFSNGEEVLINAQVYSENYDPVDDAEVRVVIQKDGFSINRLLRSIGDGRYDTRLEILEPGEYSFTGDAQKSGRVIGKDSGKFTIGEFSVEMLKTTMDSVLLGQISSASNGRYFNGFNADNLIDAIDASPEIISSHYDFFIWNRAWLLIFVIFMLCCEWLLRKRWGML